MKRFSALLAALVLLALAVPCSVRAAHLTDTILVKLPNQATMTLFVKNKQQLRELRAYKLDSLMILLDTYITQAEAAGKGSKSEQVTMEFYPAKDKPGKQLPEQIRITVRNDDKNRSHGDKVEVSMGRLFGVKVEEGTGSDGGDRVEVHLGSTPKDDSLNNVRRQAKREEKANRSGHSSFGVDLGLNALVNKQNFASEPNLDLRPVASRYISLNWHYTQRLGGRRSPLYLLTGPEFSFNNYMLDNNYRFVATDNRTFLVKDLNRSYEKSKLATSAVNLPLMFLLNVKNDKQNSAFRLGAGGFVGYRLGTHTKLKYEQDGSTRKDKDRSSYNLEDFQYGVQGLIGLRSINLFAKYNLNELFKDNRGPQAQTLSFGISFTDFD